MKGSCELPTEDISQYRFVAIDETKLANTVNLLFSHYEIKCKRYTMAAVIVLCKSLQYDRSLLEAKHTAHPLVRKYLSS